jgi:hypothetical protein
MKVDGIFDPTAVINASVDDEHEHEHEYEHEYRLAEPELSRLSLR